MGRVGRRASGIAALLRRTAISQDHLRAGQERERSDSDLERERESESVSWVIWNEMELHKNGLKGD